MPKRIIQDVIPNNRRKSKILNVEARPFIEDRKKIAEDTKIKSPRIQDKLRNVPVSVPPSFKTEHEYPKEAFIPDKKVTKDERGDIKVHSRAIKILWIIAGLALVLLFFTVSSSFASVSVNLEPKNADVSFSETLSIQRGGGSNSFHYEVVTKEKVGTKKVPANGQEKVSKKAVGTVTIFNNFSSASLRLVRNTRIALGDGRIYRLNDSIVIPGATIVDGKRLPGSKDAVVSADSPGDSFNLELTDLKGDFTFPSYQNTSKYTTIVARQKTDITGGFVGTIPTILPADRASALTQLYSELSEQIFKEIYSEVPDQFSLFNKAYTISTSSMPDMKSDDSHYGVIQAKVIFNGALFNTQSFAGLISSRKKVSLPAVPITFIPGDDYNVEVSNLKDIDWWKASGGSFTFKGTGKITTIIDVKKVQEELIGISKSEFKNILSRHTEINTASVAFHPLWTFTFPKKVERIHITINNLKIE